MFFSKKYVQEKKVKIYNRKKLKCFLVKSMYRKKYIQVKMFFTNFLVRPLIDNRKVRNLVQYLPQMREVRFPHPDRWFPGGGR